MLFPKIKGIASTSFYFTGIRDWNALPDSIKLASSLNVFKYRLKRFLLAQ
uniref:Uncharacterized protein n=1 Tax=Anguilla anguilla TaxID=7936 RepID=A0A0E9S4K1_ANGAN